MERPNPDVLKDSAAVVGTSGEAFSRTSDKAVPSVDSKARSYVGRHRAPDA